MQKISASDRSHLCEVLDQKKLCAHAQLVVLNFMQFRIFMVPQQLKIQLMQNVFFNVFHEICQVNADQPTKSQPNTPDTSEIGSQGSTPAAR